MDQAHNTRDLIISAYTNYNWAKLKYWANSIDRCGFTGDKVLIVYNSDRDTVQKLADMGFKIWAFNRDYASGNFFWPADLIIVVQRFYHMWQYLDQLPDDHYRYVITTDAKDVVFQTNPSKWLEENLGDKDIVASCESIRYRDEPWGDDNLQGSYPMLHQKMRNNPIWNCGVQAGRMRAMKELWLHIWMMCKAGGRPNPDQAAYNVLLDTKAWKQLTKFTMSEDGWACQAGTTVDPVKIASFRPHLLEAEPTWENGLAKTSDGKTHAILHQWDRIPAWSRDIEQKYG
jgi:hypothetical protein